MDDNNITIIETRDYPGTLAISKSILVPFQLFLLSKICKTFIITAIFCNGYWPDIDDKKENDVSLVQHFRILTVVIYRSLLVLLLQYMGMNICNHMLGLQYVRKQLKTLYFKYIYTEIGYFEILLI